MGWKCFMVEPTGEAKTWLRRYATESPCPAGSGKDYDICQSMVEFARLPQPWDDESKHWVDLQEHAPPANDHRWPRVCNKCNRRFDESIPYQVLSRQIYRAEDGREWTQDDLPPGAMFYSPWHELFGTGPDGKALAVVLPPDHGSTRANDIWHIDGGSSSGGGWTRSGTPPIISTNPSILTPSYHGYITDGKLWNSLDDRPLPPGPD